MHRSLWSDTAVLPQYEKLTGDLKTDVLVIGGGMCGLLCAYYLKQAGVDCTVVEAQRIAGGVTADTTAKVTALHGLIYGDLVKNAGVEAAGKYLYANQQAVEEFARLCKEAECDFQRRTAYTYSLQERRRVEREFSILQRLGANVEMQYESPLPISFAAAVGLPSQGQFHPLKFLSHIVKGLKIYEHTAVTEFLPGYVRYERGKIKAKKVIVATHFPILNKHGMYFLKLYQHRSYVVALEHAQSLDGMYVDASSKGLSFRTYGDMLLLGGGGGRTGKKCGNWVELQQFQKKFYPESRIAYQWATQDCISLDKMPLIGKYSPSTPNLYVATGFNKWGMTSSMVAARVLCDAITGVQNDYADIFAPDRSIWKPQLLVNGVETLTNFVYPTTKRCPHLGCALKWNKQEHSWDCPCHGSRFAPDGTLLNNPANRNKG
ncbi:MAG: FAD-dependent oxidoreductase [Ruminococcaceae bacterium]|nr:FAD-dependent oxidoreductase [Oscillospiraceae bacterium]